MNDWDSEAWRMNNLHRWIMEDLRRLDPEHYEACHDKLDLARDLAMIAVDRDLAKIAKMDEFPEETDKVVNDILARMMK